MRPSPVKAQVPWIFHSLPLRVWRPSFSTTYETPITYKLRWKAQDSASEMDQSVVYDYFDVKIQYGCTQDTVSLINGGAGRDS